MRRPRGVVALRGNGKRGKMSIYKNLAFKGGGVRGIAYFGAIKYLYEQRLLSTIQRVAGTSAGAVTAALVSFNLENYDELKAIGDSLDYRKVPGEGPLNAEHSRLLGMDRMIHTASTHTLLKNLQGSLRLIQDKGWHSSEYFYEWIRSAIAKQFKEKKGSYTFRDFKDASLHIGARPFLDLYITGTDLSNRRDRLFSFETTPDMEVALAVRISMSIPLFFETISFQYPGTDQPQFYVDGGVMKNYPIEIFDSRAYGGKFSKGINRETLGFFLFSRPERAEYKEIKGVIDYTGALLDSLHAVQEELVLRREKAADRTVFIDDMGVSPTHFDIAEGDELYRKLFDSGYESTRDFFAKKGKWSSAFRLWGRTGAQNRRGL